MKNGYNQDVVKAWFKECGIPEPEFEYRFHATRKWRFDMCWPLHEHSFGDEVVLLPNIAIECQGGIWYQGRHNRGAAMLKEWEKLNHAAIEGWRILYCQPKDLCTQEFANTIKRALGI